MTNNESRYIDWATRHHRGKNIARRRMVGNKSRAGGVIRRNHFTAMEANLLPRLAVGENPGSVRYAVKRQGKTLGVYARRSQAEAVAAAHDGYVGIL